MSKFKSNKGITLVALIITIIVLLILAMVSISLIINSGIITKSKSAVDRYSDEEIQEMIKTGYSEYKMSQFTGQALSLRQAINNSGLAITDEDITGEGPWTITVGGKSYTLSTNGAVGIAEVIDMNTVIANAQKHPNQTSTDDIGIDMYGNSVNLDYWDYELNQTNDTFGTGKDIGSGMRSVGYKGQISDVDGKIVGEIPQFIKKDDKTYTLTSLGYCFKHLSLTTAPTIPNSVTDMGSTFNGCTSLTTVGNIPNSVTDMNYTFKGCTSLTTVGTIGNSVTNMGSTFDGCTSLTTVGNIPNSVTDMNYTFKGCTSLTTVGTIGNSVTNMVGTFNGCYSLTGNLVINANSVSQYSNCFTSTARNEGCNLVVSGTCPQLDDIIATKSESSHITKGN